ncbi:MAG TPA: hypothetical protein VL993_01060 [Stellaceae bacterium]|nr:hypothetical protein [Stellaceae bacterium]
MAARSEREVLLVGSMPVRPVESVFETVSTHLGPLAHRIPDGEMMGWLRQVWRSHALNPLLEEDGETKLNGNAALALPLYRLKPGVAAKDLALGPYGYAENARRSHAAFARLRRDGKIPPQTRLQVCMAGPGTTAYVIKLPADELLPLARVALLREIEAMVATLPPSDLAIQLDVAMEAEHEEYLRRPDAFDTPVHDAFHWTHEQMAQSVAWLADRIPAEIELGFHICSIWHHCPEGGQDNEVMVDTANLLSERIGRPIAYIHIPIIPEHDSVEDYAPLGRLRLHRETKLFLGLLNLADGLDGARRRIALAESIVPDFGVSFFCGLGMPPGGYGEGEPGGLRRVPGSGDPSAPALRPTLKRATVDTIGDVLDLHRRAAAL